MGIRINQAIDSPRAELRLTQNLAGSSVALSHPRFICPLLFQEIDSVNGRATSFILLSSTIMMVALLLKGMYGPQPPAEGVGADGADSAKGIANTELVESANGSEPEVSSGSVDAPSSATAQSPDSDQDTKPSTETAAEQSSDPSDDEGGTNTGSPDTKLANTSGDSGASLSDDSVGDDPVAKPESSDKFIQIGSLSPTSLDRYLITVNEKAGTIHRVELNFRNQKNGRFQFRDLLYKGGYLGCLECQDATNGAIVRAVGLGTPAAESGIQVDDILVALNGETIASASEFESMMDAKTKPRETVSLKIQRGDKELSLDVVLTDKPIELLKPEENREDIDPDYDYPESFVFSLLKPTGFDAAWPDLDTNMRNGNWQVDSSDENQVSLKYDIPSANLREMELSGPITVYKRFRIPKLQPDSIHLLGSKSFHFEMELEIVNGSDQIQSLAFQLDGPTGSPPETWWYANKIHGRTMAIGSIAGARDVIGATAKRPFIFLGGPEIVKNANKENTAKGAHYICDHREDDPKERELFRIGVDSQYFNVTLIPQMEPEETYEVSSVVATTNGGKIPKNARLQKLVDCTFTLVKTIDVDADSSYKQTFDVFAGPKEADLLEIYGLGDARSFGWFAWCSKPLMSLLHFFYWITGSWSYGLAIIMLTILVRSLMIPISRKAALNAQMMQHLQPQMKEIADKYKDDMEKRASSQRELFKKYKYNPFGGCFMMFFQLPIFIGLYRGLSVDIALRDAPLIPGLRWCSDLSGPDQLFLWKDWMPAMLASETGWLGPFFNILPILTMILFLAQQKLFMPPATDDQGKMMQKMMTFMMLFMGVMFFKVAAGLCIYFITSSLWGIIERVLLPKPQLAKDKLPDAGQLTLGDAPKKKLLSKSADKAALKREEELAERKRRNSERKKRLKGRS